MRHTLRGLPPDRRDLEIQRLKDQLEAARRREGRARAEERERFSLLSAASRRFAHSMRSRMDERQRQQRRLDAQHGVSRALEDHGDLSGAAPEIFRVLGERLGWEVGVLWTVEENELRCGGVWRAAGRAPDGFEESCRGPVYGRGDDLPGRVWLREEACWVGDVLEDGGFRRREAAAAAGLRCALAFPIQDGGRLVGVFELLKGEASPVDDDLVRVAYLVGHQIGQFVERRRAERERDRALAREREARQRIGGILESINDAFFALDEDWRFTYVNRRAEEFWESPRGDLAGKNIWEEFPWAVDTEAHRAILEAAKTGETVGFETFSPFVDAWISGRAYPSPGGVSVYFQDVTEREELRREAEAGRARLEAVLQQMPDGVFIADRSGRIFLANEGATRIYGREIRTVEECGRHSLSYPGCAPIPEDDYPLVRALAGETTSMEHYVVRPDGTLGIISSNAAPVLDAEGRVVAAVKAFQDVTELKETRRAVEERERRYRTLTSNIPGAVFRCVHREGTPVMEFVSERIREITGHPAEGFIDDRERSYVDVIHPDDRPANEARVLRALEARETYNIEYRLLHAGGGIRWVNERGSGVFSEGGDLLWIDGAIFDVTDRKAAEEALLENDEWLRLAQRYAGSGTWEWDLRTDEIRWSDEHRELFGLSDETLGREDWWGTVHPEDLPSIEEAGRRCLEEDGEWPEIEYRIFRGGEVRWIAARGQTERDENGRAVRILGISVDATERKEAERERDRLLAREWVAHAEAAERERISRELHDRVAHSMGVAHQSLQLHGVLAGTDPRRAAEKLELAGEMTKAALESTRNLSAELRRLEAEDGLEAELGNLLKVAVPPSIRTDICVRGDEAAVPGHVRGQLFLVLREAVRNAVSHSGCGTLSVGLAIAPEKVVGVVEDDGRGFDATGDGDGGVGLRSMRERAALLDGVLRLDCEPDRGTRVEVSVPLAGGR